MRYIKTKLRTDFYETILEKLSWYKDKFFGTLLFVRRMNLNHVLSTMPNPSMTLYSSQIIPVSRFYFAKNTSTFSRRLLIYGDSCKDSLNECLYLFKAYSSYCNPIVIVFCLQKNSAILLVNSL